MIFVTHLWRGHGVFKHGVPSYGVKHVKTMASMLERHGGHKLVCITDDPPAVRRVHVRTIEMPPEVRMLPDFLPKLWAWSDEVGKRIGERYACIDLDAVVLADLEPLFRGSEMVIWNWCGGEYYNTSLFALDPGCRARVWSEFSLDKVALARQDWLGREIVDGLGRHRSTVWTGDQSWVSWILGPGEATFGPEDGVMQFRRDRHTAGKPPRTKCLFFCGPIDPRTVSRDVPWLAKEWR